MAYRYWGGYPKSEQGKRNAFNDALFLRKKGEKVRVKEKEKAYVVEIDR